ncbi:HD domain-containing phosphohydrolase [Burkholderia gladioli]|uniref:HD domain-containing phosphohydrolase n=2 Tax=Burkholderia TaxID=32008 RepID=UPI00163E04E1|nr:HD domain-containing phosphohydrolase [Burkholderia gladioli]MDN7466074.1 HD domain-containing phosphohydrolase [Burkholderia gladioli]MDN7755276.1 HD domain-containing phosphohydrolase [Burkholderia gladioli]
MSASTASLTDAILALAFVGDLSMGRSTDHSRRTACLAGWLAAEAGAGPEAQNHARAAAMLRWSGCTANASGFADLLGDDVASREAMMAQRLPPMSAQMHSLIVPLALIHCEISGDIAVTLGMPSGVVLTLRRIFERHDGKGMPEGLDGDAVPSTVYFVNLASDLEILARAHGREAALAYLRAQGGAKYPAALAELCIAHAEAWLDTLDAGEPDTAGWRLADQQDTADVALSLLADVTELKLPWLAGYARRVASLASRAAARLGLDAAIGAELEAAALLHGIGRAALPNRLWDTPGRLSSDQWEQVRLVPYWTARAAQQIGGLRGAAGLASHAYERLDGSGYFRGLSGTALDVPQRLLAGAVACQALLDARPWRAAHSIDAAAGLLQAEAAAGRFDPEVIAAVVETAGGPAPAPRRPVTPLLSPREIEVLRQISGGLSNKEAARVLALSPSTVRTHVESIFRKLDCSTRAAATLKALTTGLL